jgi:hypothetical protein
LLGRVGTVQLGRERKPGIECGRVKKAWMTGTKAGHKRGVRFRTHPAAAAKMRDSFVAGMTPPSMPLPDEGTEGADGRNNRQSGLLAGPNA